MTVTIGPAAEAAVPLPDIKDYLRITLADEDAMLTGLIAVATEMAELFTGQILVARVVEEVVPASPDWQRLSIRPVRGVHAVTGIDMDGAETPLAADAYVVDIDRNGDGWIRIIAPGSARKCRLSYSAGIAADAAGVPDAIRHGIVRLAGEYYARRDGLDVQPPAAVAALWRPWRRMRLA